MHAHETALARSTTISKLRASLKAKGEHATCVVRIWSSGRNTCTTAGMTHREMQAGRVQRRGDPDM